MTNCLWVVLDAKKFRRHTLLRWTLRSLLTLHARDIGDWGKILNGTESTCHSRVNGLQQI